MINGEVLSVAIIFTIIFSSGCNTSPQTSASSPIVEVQITGTEKNEISLKTISQPNCTGSAEVENVESTSKEITYSIQVLNGMQVNSNGQVGFAGTDIELGATISSQLGQSYGMSEKISRSITLKANPGTDMQHTVRQVEIWKVGNAKITVGGQESIVPFKYLTDFDIELVNSRDLMDCASLIANNSTVAPETNNNNATEIPNKTEPCFPQVGWTAPSLTQTGEWLYNCLSSGQGNWVGQTEAWKSTNWKHGSSSSEIVEIVIPEGASKMGLGCDPCTVVKPDGTTISSPSNSTFGSFKPNLKLDVTPNEVYKVKIFGGDTCPSRPEVIPPCPPEIYIWFNLP